MRRGTQQAHAHKRPEGLYCFDHGGHLGLVMAVHMGSLLARIPLLLSLPTIILSSNLIWRNGSYNSTILGNVTMLAILPSFSAASFVNLAFTFKIVSNAKYMLPLLAFSFFAFQASIILGPIQATCLSLLTSKLIFENYTSNLSFLKLYKVYGLLMAVSIFISVQNTHIILVLLPYVEFLAAFHSFKLSKNTLEEQKPLISVTTLLTSVQIVTFALLYYISLCVPYLGSVQLLMVFIFAGCLFIFYLSLHDMINDLHAQYGSDLYSQLISSASVLTTGILAIALQFLSFNIISTSTFSDICTLTYVGLTEAITTFLVQEENIPRHTHEHQSTCSNSQDNDTTIWKQMAFNQETKPIFSFFLLNTTFMFVQLLYSFRSKSLGLLSDSLHMALDSTSLLLGLLASTLKKKPPTDKFPFALGYLETLTGFTNGVLLLGIVCGIFVKAVERIFNPIDLHGTNELLLVAVLGLAVNLVGLFAFDHGSHTDNQNMRGVFLHILADTLGSVGVIISTLLTKMTHLPIFDPIASIFIGSLILLSAIPLINSTTSSILLKLDDKKHNLVKNALNQISTSPGISGYTTPRFWAPSAAAQQHSHGHTHTHEHTHEDHSHSHITEKEDTSFNKDSLIGYIHIQYVEGENSTIIKKRVEKIFQSVGIKAWVQVEPRDSTCWCRSSSITQSVIPKNTLEKP